MNSKVQYIKVAINFVDEHHLIKTQLNPFQDQTNFKPTVVINNYGTHTGASPTEIFTSSGLNIPKRQFIKAWLPTPIHPDAGNYALTGKYEIAVYAYAMYEKEATQWVVEQYNRTLTQLHNHLNMLMSSQKHIFKPSILRSNGGNSIDLYEITTDTETCL